MDVDLYVYDLSRGLARTMSAALLGTQVDAVYHTSIVIKGIEYVYDGGIKRVNPGQTHLGRPEQIIKLGRTELPMDVITEYLESLESIFTAAAYDLWTHNCNNFSNDFATFLLGKGIPEHITNLPATVLNSPFGRMLRPQIDNMLQLNKQNQTGLLGIDQTTVVNGSSSGSTMREASHLVKSPRNIQELDGLLNAAKHTCAIIFFTSATCAPCKQLYPLYDELAAEAGPKATVIKVDTNTSFDISSKYSIRATPTFITFLRGGQENRWSGGGSSQLRGNFNMLLQMAWPPHPHESLRLPTLRNAGTKPIIYAKLPPLEKLMAKMGTPSKDPSIQGIKRFVSTRATSGAAEATLPNLNGFSAFLQKAVTEFPTEILFTAVDLFRVALVDPRLSGFYAEEQDHKTITTVLNAVNNLQNCPYSLRLVTVQMACNLFSSPLYEEHILNCAKLRMPLVQLITTSLLDDTHTSVRVAAASLVLNMAMSNWKWRTEKKSDGLPDGDQVEIAASLLESITVEETSPQALKEYLLALGYLVFCVPPGGELVDLLKTMDAQGTILAKGKSFKDEVLVKEIGEVLLGKGI